MLSWLLSWVRPEHRDRDDEEHRMEAVTESRKAREEIRNQTSSFVQDAKDEAERAQRIRGEFLFEDLFGPERRGGNGRW